MGQRDIPGADLTTTVYTTVHLYDVEGEVEIRRLDGDGSPYMTCGKNTMIILEGWEELAALERKIADYLAPDPDYQQEGL